MINEGRDHAYPSLWCLCIQNECPLPVCKLPKDVINSPSKHRLMLPTLRNHIAQGDVKVYQFTFVSSINVDIFITFFLFRFFFFFFSCPWRRLQNISARSVSIPVIIASYARKVGFSPPPLLFFIRRKTRACNLVSTPRALFLLTPNKRHRLSFFSLFFKIKIMFNVPQAA